VSSKTNERYVDSIANALVSGDNQFFATCSDDGSVKIWDSQRLEKNVTNRSRLTYATQGSIPLLFLINEF